MLELDMTMDGKFKKCDIAGFEDEKEKTTLGMLVISRSWKSRRHFSPRTFRKNCHRHPNI